MHFLVDASLPGSTADVVVRHNHVDTDVRDIGMASAKDEAIAQKAKDEKMAILTADVDFADIRIYRPEDYFGIVVIRPGRDANTAVVVSMIESVFANSKIIDGLVGRPVVVGPKRIRVRPPIMNGK